MILQELPDEILQEIYKHTDYSANLIACCRSFATLFKLKDEDWQSRMQMERLAEPEALSPSELMPLSEQYKLRWQARRNLNFVFSFLAEIQNDPDSPLAVQQELIYLVKECQQRLATFAAHPHSEVLAGQVFLAEKIKSLFICFEFEYSDLSYGQRLHEWWDQKLSHFLMQAEPEINTTTVVYGA